MNVATIVYLIEAITRSAGWILITLAFWLQSKELKALKADIRNLTNLLCSIISNVNRK